MNRRACLLALTLLTAGRRASALPSADEKTPVSPQCAAPEYRQLDFWVGDWDAYEVGGSAKPVARARIDVILGGCAIREVYEQTDGLLGQSFTVYDASRRVWHQTWVTNRGQLLTIEGAFDKDALTLEGPLRSPTGPERTIRGVWQAQDGGVREIAHTSPNGGRSWQPYFDIIFRRHTEPKP